MIKKRHIARGMMATGSLVYLLGIWLTCPLLSGKGYLLVVLVMGMFA
ncbi:YiaA/YiaB family inner membrane protein, partial [Klebsiella pneumoniae]